MQASAVAATAQPQGLHSAERVTTHHACCLWPAWHTVYMMRAIPNWHDANDTWSCNWCGAGKFCGAIQGLMEYYRLGHLGTGPSQSVWEGCTQQAVDAGKEGGGSLQASAVVAVGCLQGLQQMRTCMLLMFCMWRVGRTDGLGQHEPTSLAKLACHIAHCGGISTGTMPRDVT
jgi:hypothetical protein